MALNVCLINLPTFQAPKSLSYFGSVPPLGLAYVAAAIRSAGHNLQIIDSPGESITQFRPYSTYIGDLLLHGLSAPEILDRIDSQTDVIGYTNMFLHEWNFLKNLLKLVKEQFPDVINIVGGENPTAWWNYMLDQSSDLDICVLGEGEEKMVRLLASIEMGGDIKTVPSVAFRAGTKAMKTPSSSRIINIDEIPWPAWDLFPIEAYLDFEYGSGVNRGRSLPMLTSRGCPYQCTFCSSPEMWTTRYYSRDVEKVADEIQFYKTKYNVTNINFNDLTAVLTKNWIINFCQIIQDRNLEISWQLPSGTRSEAVDPEAATFLYKSGCRNFGYAPESGSPRILKIIKKKVKLPSLINSLKGALEAGLNTQANIIIGFPHENLNDLWLTYKLILKMAVIGLHSTSVMVFAPYPGSEYYRSLLSENKIQFDNHYFYSTLLRSVGSLRSYHPVFKTWHLFSIQLLFLFSFFGLQYALRPWRIVKLTVNLLKQKQESVMDQFLSTKFKQLFQDKNRSSKTVLDS